MSPRGSQPDCGFFSEQEKQQYTQIEDLAKYGAIISNQAPEAGTSTMVVVKWSDKVEGYGDNIYSPLCSGLYKEEDDSLVSWSGSDPGANSNCFTCFKEDNDSIVSGDQ